MNGKNKTEIKKQLKPITLNKFFFNILFCIALLAFNAKGQVNLLLNPSFEDTIGICPVMGEFNKTRNWFTPSDGTSDLHNTCFSGYNTGVPVNFCGNQFAYDGNSYAGLFIFWTVLPPQYREYIQGKFIAPLIANRYYSISFYISYPDRVTLNCPNLQGCITNDSIHYTTIDTLPLIPNVYFDSTYVYDTLNWQKVEGIYKATGGEKYLILGNFYGLNRTKIDTVLPMLFNEFGAYLYIDAVTFKEVEEIIQLPNIFTPNGDGINEFWYPVYEGIEIENIYIYNRWGNLVWWGKDKWNGKNVYDELVAEGIYYCIVNYKNYYEIAKTKKGFIQVLK